jgi:uncharacterized protein YndB with AHSA1/START domain
MGTQVITFTVDVARPPEEVFSFVADPRNLPAWDPQVVAVSVAPDGPVRLGSEVTETRRVFGRPLAFKAVVVEYEPGRRFAVRGGGAFPILHRVLFEPSPTGTRLTVHAEATLRGPLLLVAPLMSRQGRRMFLASYRGLAALLSSDLGAAVAAPLPATGA